MAPSTTETRLIDYTELLPQRKQRFVWKDKTHRKRETYMLDMDLPSLLAVLLSALYQSLTHRMPYPTIMASYLIKELISE